MDGIIRAEWDPLQKVFVHKPGMEMFFGLLEPYGSLYERAFSRTGACNEHDMFTKVLSEECDVEVCYLRDTILQAAKKHPRILQKLIAKARDALAYEGDPKYTEMAQNAFDKNCSYYDPVHFFDILLLHPLIKVAEYAGTRNVSIENILRQPVANLYFMRDQQFVTDHGIVICKMAKPSRARETEIVKFLWDDILGHAILHEMHGDAKIEGGEFIPLGDFALIGIGDRTNREAIDQLLQLNLDYQEIGVVHQPNHPLIPSKDPDPQINMHLDTYFNIAGNGIAVGSHLLIKQATVEVYHNEGEGHFVKDTTETTLYNYMLQKNFDVIDITTLEQMSYASNFLCIRDRQIIGINVEPIARDVLVNLRRMARAEPKKYGLLLEQAEKDYHNLMREGGFFPYKKEIYHYGINVHPVSVKNLTGGYGGTHCMTCALNRGY